MHAEPPVAAVRPGLAPARLWHWIGGRAVPGEGNRLGDVFDPSTGARTGQVPLGTAAEVDAAARARDPRVQQVSVGLSGSWSVVEIVRPDGFVAWASDTAPRG